MPEYPIIGKAMLSKKVRLEYKKERNFIISLRSYCYSFFLSTFFSLGKCASGSSFTCRTCSPVSQYFGSGSSSGFTCDFFSHTFKICFQSEQCRWIDSCPKPIYSIWLTLLTIFNVFPHHAKHLWQPKSHNGIAIRLSME